jgi:membrane associated rhomboid family serine protease
VIRRGRAVSPFVIRPGLLYIQRMSQPHDDLIGRAEGPSAEAGTEPAAPRREPVFNLPASVLAVIALCVAVHLVRVYMLSAGQDLALLIRAAFIPIRYSGRFHLDVWAFTSPFTYTFLHGGFAHLAVNAIWLAAFGSPLANRLGAPRFLAFFALTGVAAAFFFWAIHPLTQAPLVGASGAISGMMGAAARFAFRIDRASGRAAFGGDPLPFGAVLRSRTAVTFLAVWMIVNLVTGVVGFVPGSDDQIAWEAHIGGLLAGFFGLRFFDRKGDARAT